jgi:nitroimidazol reductase NimA-like FMN-containing flavoprotein (pyridoxamine 5'-phosphate oxidase superfamily)/osmotically-inducible protein OsmY
MLNNAAVQTRLAVDDAPLLAVLDNFNACETILNDNSVGRIAFALQDRVSIVPVHYVYDGGWICGRTAAGGKLREILRNRRVAFEVDEHSRLFEWRSVVVRGPLYLIEPGTTPSDRRVYAKAVSLMRRLVPSTLTDSDPVPFRDQLFRIRVAEISGRTSEPTGGRRIFPKSVRTSPQAAGAEPGDSKDPGPAELDAVRSHRVEDALARFSLSPGSQVHVEAFDGVIVLSGIVEDAAERNAVEAAALFAPGVQAVVEQLETVSPARQQPTPAEVAREAVRQLRMSPPITDAGIKVVVEHGWLRVEGVVNSPASREEIVRRLVGIKGSRGVIDKLRMRGPLQGNSLRNDQTS